MDSGKKIPAVSFTPNYPPRPKAARKALLINDTSTCYTWGNAATVAGLENALVARGYDVASIHTLELPWFATRTPALQDFDDPAFLSQCRYRDPTLFWHLENCDAVIVNGEGHLNGLSESAVRIMYLAYAAKNFFGRKTAIVNHSCFPEGGTALTDARRLAYYLKVYKAMDACCAREGATRDILASLQVPVEQGFDACVLWAQHYLEDKPAAARRKQAIVTAGPGYDSRLAETMAQLCKTLKQRGLKPVLLKGARWQGAQEDMMLAADLQDHGIDIEVITAPSLEAFMETVREARLVAGGFFQNNILACAAGTPVISLTTGSNHVAMAALAKMSDLPVPLHYADPALGNKITDELKSILNQPVTNKKTAEAQLELMAAAAARNLAVF